MSHREEQELVAQHTKLVHSIAKKISAFAPSTMDYEDLISYGQEGLIQASRRYDPDRGVSFVTFAYYRIRGAMYDGIRKMGNLPQINRRLNFEEKADHYMEQQSAQPPPSDAKEAARRLTNIMSDLAVAYVMTTKEVSEEPENTIPDPSEVVERKQEFSIVKKNFNNLPENEKDLLRLMYFEGMAMQDAAQQLGMSKGWASRLHARALTRLRKGSLPPSDQTAIPIRV